MLRVKVHLIAEFLWFDVVGDVDDGVLERGFAAHGQGSMVFVRLNCGTHLID